jgi:hypothetical protein
VLGDTIDAPRVELPFLFTPALGPDNIDTLSHVLENALQ